MVNWRLVKWMFLMTTDICGQAAGILQNEVNGSVELAGRYRVPEFANANQM